MAGLLAAIRAGSPFLDGLVAADPARLLAFMDGAPETELARLVAEQGALAAAYAAGQLSRDEVAARLRRHRSAHALLVALADLARVWGVEEVTDALTRFADASVGSAVAVAVADAVAAGHLDRTRFEADGRGSGLVVLALGKHGAGELNYSSDIDLIVFFDPKASALTGSIAPTRVYNGLAKTLVKLLSERRVDGYVHRVDYRLRPDPGSTPAAVSLPAAYTYYESLGQNWERAAMIKARPVAGDVALGQAFLAELQPFVWRKYFDFASIADVHAMKRQIHAVRGFGEIAVAGHDIKLGRGGIREIEFFVQTQQLVFGGRRPRLRGRRTLDMLAVLWEEGWITEAARDELTAAYRFLREIEHRLQMVADEQTQRLPADQGALERFARFAGFRDAQGFATELTRQARIVQRHYALLFEDAPNLASDVGDLVFTGTASDPATLATLDRLGFRDPERAAETIRGWHFGRRAAIVSARAREVLTELVPALLKAIGGSGDPDGALARLDQAFGRMPAAVELLVILRQHESLRTLFADVLGSAPRLADEVSSRPHVLDAVIDPAFARPDRDPDAIEADLRDALGHPEGTEEFLDRLRDAAHQLQFVTGARLLSGILTPREAGRSYAAVARAPIRAALDHVGDSFAREHGRVPGGAVAVLGLGRLGASDLTATSDLDLVIVYDFDPADRASDGGRPLDAVVYYTRLTQRLFSALTAPTRRGKLFDVDMRLRPSGTKGPVATQLSSFVSYHAGEAELWEHMALTRARVLAGEPSLATRVEDEIASILLRRRDRAAVYRGVLSMRGLVAREKGEDEHDLKLASGGLLDLDFLAQALVLAHAADHRDLAGASSVSALERAGQAGLLAGHHGATLVEAYRLLDGALHLRRLTVGEGPAEAARSPALLARLARLAGAPDAAAFAAQLAEARAAVRAIVRRVLSS